jgi:hypothetical protein
MDVPLRGGDLRMDLYRVCVDQGLGADAAYVAISAIDRRLLDDQGYRDAQLAAGLVEGRLHLMAYALGAAASGMTFSDFELRALLEDEALFGLLITCVGVPEYASRRAGEPGRPTRVGNIQPRLDDR